MNLTKLTSEDILGTGTRPIDPGIPVREFLDKTFPNLKNAPGEDVDIKITLDSDAIIDIAGEMNPDIEYHLLEHTVGLFSKKGFDKDGLVRLANINADDKEIEDLQEIDTGTPKDVKYYVNVFRLVARAYLDYIDGRRPKKILLTILQDKTPLQAWILKRKIEVDILKTPRGQVGNGYDNGRQLLQVLDNFPAMELVLWRKGIFDAATRGSESFVGTTLSEELCSSVMPMFWQFENPFTLNSDIVFDFDIGIYECVGFTIQQFEEELNQVTFRREDVMDVREDKRTGKLLVTVDDDQPQVRKAMNEALKNPVKIATRGLSMSIIFTPLGHEGDTVIRTIKPIFVDHEIDNNMHAILIAAAQFLTLKYVAKDKTSFANSELKHADRDLHKKVRQNKVKVPDLHIINLRRPEIRKQTNKEKESGRKFSCHFWVDAFWRNQYYPSTKTHKIIRVSGFCKGNLEMPFREKKVKIYKAVR